MERQLKMNASDNTRSQALQLGRISKQFLILVGTSRCDVPARVCEGGTNAIGRAENCAAEVLAHGQGADGAARRPYQEQCQDAPLQLTLARDEGVFALLPPINRPTGAAIFFLLLLLAPGFARADDWPHWRGPNRNGISLEKDWRSEWPADGPPIAWKASVGTGFSCISVASGRVFTMGHADEQDNVFCLDAKSGKELWKKSYPAELGDKYFEGGTTGTPCVDGNRVFTLSRWGDVFCLEADTGKIVWQRNLHTEAGMRVPGWGFAGSPVVYENLLLLNVGDTGMALDKTTGKTLWESASKEPGYSTPLPCQEAGKWVVLLGSGKSYVAVDLQTGREQWRMKWLTEYGVNSTDPIPDGDRVFISTGYGKGAALLKPAPPAEPEVVWKSKVLCTQLNSAVLVDGFLYGMDGDAGDTAPLKCVEYSTGTEKWAYPHVGTGGVIAADGKLIVLGSKGELMLFSAMPASPKILAQAQVLGGKCWTAPVLANGFIYCRNSRGDVVCLDVRK